MTFLSWTRFLTGTAGHRDCVHHVWPLSRRRLTRLISVATLGITLEDPPARLAGATGCSVPGASTRTLRGRSSARSAPRSSPGPWGTVPSALAREVSALPAGTRVLDLGCGEGRDSVFFATVGCHVTGVDVSRAGLRKAERLARESEVGVRRIQGDMPRVTVD